MLGSKIPKFTFSPGTMKSFRSICFGATSGEVANTIFAGAPQTLEAAQEEIGEGPCVDSLIYVAPLFFHMIRYFRGLG